MNETIKTWLADLYITAIAETKSAIKNEKIWEFGYMGPDPNPHTENIELFKEYIEVLEEKIAELEQI